MRKTKPSRRPRSSANYENSESNPLFAKREVWVAGYELETDRARATSDYDCDWYAWDASLPDAETLAREWAADVVKMLHDPEKKGQRLTVFVCKCDGYPFATDEKNEMTDEFCEYADEWEPWSASTEWHALMKDGVPCA